MGNEGLLGLSPAHRRGPNPPSPSPFRRTASGPDLGWRSLVRRHIFLLYTLEWVVKRAGGPNGDRSVEGEEQSRGLHLKKEDVAPLAQKEEVAVHKKVKVSIAQAQIRATFYPKFENEKSDQEVRTRMHEVVSAGLGVLEVSMKHSGSLFLYSGDNGGAFAKNSYGNLYTAVGVFVLKQTLQGAWGPQAGQKQRELNDYLQEHRICIGMELVTAVLGDHGQRHYKTMWW